jgi:glycosyltransferase involved in cell wall biosynthesis
MPISIIIPCLQMAATLGRALESCLIQPEAAQIIVVDDGSTDASIEVAQRPR